PCSTLAIDFDGTLERYASLNVDGSISLRTIIGDNELYRFPGLGPSWGLAFSLNGQYLAQEYNGRLIIWKLTAPKPLVVTEEHNVSGWAFSPDSRQYVIGFTDRRVRLSELPSTLCRSQFLVSERPRHFAFDPKHPRLAIAFARVVQVRA